MLRLQRLEMATNLAKIKTESKKIDREWTQMMLKAERDCGKPRKSVTRSPQLAQAGRTLRYWRRRLHGKKKSRKIIKAFESLAEQLGLLNPNDHLSILTIRKKI